MRDKGIGQAPSGCPKRSVDPSGQQTGQDLPHGHVRLGRLDALRFAEGGTVVVSRRHPDLLDGEPDGVVMMIVKKIYTKDTRTPAYFYAVDAHIGLVCLMSRLYTHLGLVTVPRSCT